MINVAIDGPGGAGKSTISRRLAQELGYIYVDTGALYRTVGLYCIQNNIDTKDVNKVVSILNKISLSITFLEGEQRVLLNEKDVTKEIRRPDVSMAASNVSSIPEVRKFLFHLQKDLAKNNNCIMDGRDIGTVVLPNAQVKIFLTASVEERALRRYKELMMKNITVDYNNVLEELKQRDKQDTERAAAPLKPAKDAICVDTTHDDFESSVQILKALILKNIQKN